MQVYISDILLISGLKSRESYVRIDFAGCDFKCGYCDRQEILDFKVGFQRDIKEVKEKIKEYVGVAGAIIFSGAEPCLQRQALQNLAKYCKGLGFKIILKTNGTSPSLLGLLVKGGLVDKVRIEFKAPLIDGIFERVTKSRTFFKSSDEVIDSFEKSLEIIKKNDNKIGVVFRTVIVPGLLYKKEDILWVAKRISAVNCVWVLQQFNNEGIDGMFGKIDSPSISFLENLKEICMKEYSNLRIHIIGC
ncbi:radical SAM protein [Candidatus Woesearchaeota archaeon]|nr:radical SAM protein [Candidatus Woesearchaeota archaeon]MBL7050704.1 radical SAM protein [Candidatus Woesearchaeota archaeon]